MRLRWYLIAVVTVGLLMVLAGCGNPVQPGVSLSATSPSGTLSPGQEPKINEFVFDHAGADNHEYIEIFGDANTDYSDLVLVEIEGGGSGAGTVDGVFQLGATSSLGFWTTGFLSNVVENGSVTVLLVRGFTGSQGDDLDTDNDGTLDVAPWSEVVDAVAVDDGGSSDRTYAGFALSAYYDGNAFAPGGASRIPDGADTDTEADWVRNNFNLVGIPGYGDDLTPGQAFNTPMAENEVMPDLVTELTIPEIQGAGHESDYDGERVRTTGVVTLFTADGRSFWMQDAAGDGDPGTSDGIYVYRGADLAALTVGDLVEVTGTVSEYTYWSRPTDLSLTEITSVTDVIVLESGLVLPDPVPVDNLIDDSIVAGAAFFESLEGMLVEVAGGPVVGPTSRFGEFVMVPGGNAVPGSGFVPSISQILISSSGGGDVDYNPERIMVDDMTLEDAVDVSPGDRIKTLVGVMDYSFSNYKIQPSDIDVQRTGRNQNSHSEIPRSHRFFTVATFNVENLFDLEDEPGKDDGGSTPSPGELEIKLGKLAVAIADELGLPAVVVVQEVENQAILEVLGTRINAAQTTNYQAVSFETSDGRGIEVGFLYDADRVTLTEAFQLSGPDVDAAFGPGSASPGREPLVGVFQWQGHTITIVGNHFKSKGGDEPLYGVNWPPVRETETQRKLQAAVVRNFVNTILDVDPEAMVIVTGDLNDFQFAEPGEGDHPVGILEGEAGEVPLLNLVNEVPFKDRFTYVYEGNSQVLDHLLVSPALAEFRPKVDIIHFNAAAAESQSEVAGIAAGSSDHDPILMGVHLR